MVDNLDEHTEKVKAEYERHARQHDSDTPEAAHWVGDHKTKLRYEVLADIDDLCGKSVLDFGCGNALFLDYLDEKGINCEYYGWDISEELVEIARGRHPDAEFRVIDVLNEGMPTSQENFDYVLISGTFYIRVDTRREIHTQWIRNIMIKLWEVCDKGLAANFLTEHVEFKKDELYYSNIDELISFCVSDLSRWFTLRRDYPLWEHTIYIYRSANI